MPMLTHLRGNAIAYLALVVAMSTGTAYASNQIANGSVTRAKLAKDAVTSPKIKDGAVGSADVKDGSLTAADVADGSLTGAKVKDGSLTSADLASGVLPTTMAMSAQATGFDPAASPDVPGVRSFAFTTAGQTYIQFDINHIGMDCSAGSGFMGLYLDGAAVPGTSYDVPAFSAPESRSIGVMVTPSAGQHTATIGLDCPFGSFQSSQHSENNWFVLATKG
jgi:hypothetical protein